MDGKAVVNTAGTAEDAALVEALADRIWTEHYTPIIGPDQVRYMLREFQSAAAIYRDMTEGGYIYFIAFADGEAAGYCAARPDESLKGIFLSKLYVEKGFRGRGISRQFLERLSELAARQGCSHIWLTVNKNNSSSIAVYKKLGFRIVEAVVTDIGGGFVMDDYKMRLELPGNSGQAEESLSIVTAEACDLGELLGLQKLAYRSEAEIYGDFDIPPLRETLDEIRENAKTSVILKAVKNGKTVGSVRGFEKDGTCFIGRLIVHPEHQNRGIGGRLLTEIQKRFEGARFELFTGHKSEKNLALYEKHGFHRFKTERASEKLMLVYLEKPVPERELRA
jgi:ribosomal protein S18 acetylase RimI-like enzyme